MGLKKSFSKKNLFNSLFFYYLFMSLNFYSQAHIKGYFLTKEEAAKESLEIGCIGVHKNKEKWLPCKDEKDLHKYLRK